MTPLKTSIIYFLIILIHSAIDWLLDGEVRIWTYVAVSLAILITGIISGYIASKNNSKATLPILVAIILVSYVITIVILSNFAWQFADGYLDSQKYVIQTMSAIIYLIASPLYTYAWTRKFDYSIEKVIAIKFALLLAAVSIAMTVFTAFVMYARIPTIVDDWIVAPIVFMLIIPVQVFMIALCSEWDNLINKSINTRKSSQ